ncbi:MAG TPA: SseB family protein [Trebonia sp.]|nr:SseB family protein [Trebonia sp.]
MPAASRSPFPGRPRGDEGAPDRAATAALAAWAGGDGGEHAALAALAGVRLLVPVVALLTELDEAVLPRGDDPPSTPRGGAGKESEMALPTLVGHDGRIAIIAFTGVEAVRRWRPGARPVPTPAARVWRAAVTEGQSVVIDVAGPVPFVVEGARLAALARGESPPPPWHDPDVGSAVGEVVAATAGLTGFTLAPPAAGGDLLVTLRVAAPGAADAARAAAPAIAARLASRFRRGVELAASL